MIYKEYIEAIKSKITVKYKSTNDFCKQNGFDQPTICQFLNGKVHIRTEMFFKIMQILEISPKIYEEVR